MSTRNLDKLMAPRSVVAIGASARPGSVGAAVTRNLLAGGFQGDIHLVNIKGGEIAGRPVLKSAGRAAQPRRSRRHHDAAGDRAAADPASWASSGTGRRHHHRRPGAAPTAREDNARWRKRILRAARPHLLRIVGPNCIGYAAPRHRPQRQLRAGPGSRPGGWRRSRSRAPCWPGSPTGAAAQGIGFSHLISMGDMTDVDFGDVLDMLARDYETRAVLMYVEGITQARKFMSAARSVARAEAGDRAQGRPPCRGGPGRGLAHRRDGGLGRGLRRGLRARRPGARCKGLGELFDAAETLGHGLLPRNERLAILTNGGGAGIIATDLLIDEGGELAALHAAHHRRSSTRRCRASGRTPIRSTSWATPTARATPPRSTPWPTIAASARCWR